MWELWRQDDGGHQFLIARYATLDEAEREMRDYEARGHKQVYWVIKRELHDGAGGMPAAICRGPE